MRAISREGTSVELAAAATGYELGGLGDNARYSAAERLARLIDAGPGAISAQTVTPDTALGVSAFYACTTLISSQLGTLPLQSFEEDLDGHVTRIRRTVTADMLEYQPNPEQAASLFWTTLTNHLVLRGNAYIAKVRDTLGRVVALRLLHPDRVVPWRDEHGQKWYQVTSPGGDIAHFSAFHVIHIVGMSFATGLEGHSVVDVMRRRLEATLAGQEHQTKLFEQGLNVKAVMTVPYDLDPQGEQAQGLRRDIRTFYGGASNAGSVLLLESGSDFRPVSISPHDAQFLEQMKYTAAEICSWFHIHPGEIGGESGGSLDYTSDASRDLNFLKKGLRFWKRRIEDDLYIDPDLFGVGSGRFCRFNIDALLEVDIKTRFESYEIGTRIGMYTPDDVAKLEGREPRGDDVSSMTRPQLQVALANSRTSSTTAAAQRARDVELEARAAQTPPSVTVSPAPVNVEVNVPEQPAPVVNIAAAEQPAPVVNVTVPEQPAPIVQVDVAAPDVQVDVAAPSVSVSPQIEIPVPAAKTVVFERDRAGNITEATVQETP